MKGQPVNFSDALGNVTADLTPQLWDYTTPDGTTLTVIPAGLREHPGEAEVYLRVSADTHAARIGVTTAEMPGLLNALDTGTGWENAPIWDDTLTLTPAEDGILLTVVELDHVDGAWCECTATIRIPEVQRLPFASALRRATDVARAWEN
jgi:hypothetical protein